MLDNLSSSVVTLLASAVLALVAGTASAQDIESITRNIQPIGQVCLAGQDCTDGSTAAPAAVAPASPAAAAVEPAATATPAFDVAATYQQSCALCHANPAMGAPLVGDSAAWEERMAKRHGSCASKCRHRSECNASVGHVYDLFRRKHAGTNRVYDCGKPVADFRH